MTVAYYHDRERSNRWSVLCKAASPYPRHVATFQTEKQAERCAEGLNEILMDKGSEWAREFEGIIGLVARCANPVEANHG